MKIGILTYHQAINYGAVLQAYALANEIKSKFPLCEVEIIDYEHKNRKFFKKKIVLVFALKRSIKEAMQKKKQIAIFKKFINEYLPLSPKRITDERVLKKYILSNIDIVVVGSDAVFNWNDIGIPNPYFLEGYNIKFKLAYAASSHLQRYMGIDEAERKYLENSLNSFNYIGVRDESTKSFVMQYVEKKEKVFHNCDPSIFLELSFSTCELELKLRKHKFALNKKTVFIMLMNKHYGEFVKQYFSKEYQIVALMDYNENADMYLYDLNPFEWAHVFKYGSLLITDYFHGTIFGLKNGIPVLSIDASRYNDNYYESKVNDLLNRRLMAPYVYVNRNELDSSTGYENFKKALSNLFDNFKIEKIYDALRKEKMSSESFFDELKAIVGNEY